jgi:hypothetical protein
MLERFQDVKEESAEETEAREGPSERELRRIIRQEIRRTLREREQR